MSGRPSMPVGTYGTIRCRRAGDGWEARARFRDFDGVTRQVRAAARTKTAAETALKERLRDRQKPSAGTVTPDTKLGVLADLWLAEPHPWSAGTRQTYGYAVGANIKPALAAVKVSELTVPVIDRALTVVRDKHGQGSAKTAKVCLSGMCKLAVRHGALASNPVRDTIALPRSERRKATRALTVEQTKDLTGKIRTSERARLLDMPDLVDWMLYTGCRIGEACAARDELNDDGEQVLDLDAGTWEIDATLKRLTSEGLVIQRRTKTAAGWRVIALPPAAVALVRRRRGEIRLGPPGILFPAPRRKDLRDPSNTPGDIREILDSIDCDHCHRTGYVHDKAGKIVYGRNRQPVRCKLGPYSWVTSHTFRKTVATRLDEAGCTPREVADQLGHSRPSMTQDFYFGRHVVNARAAKILDR